MRQQGQHLRSDVNCSVLLETEKMEEDMCKTLAQLQARFNEQALSVYGYEKALSGTIVSSNVAVDTCRMTKRIKRKNEAKKKGQSTKTQ